MNHLQRMGIKPIITLKNWPCKKKKKRLPKSSCAVNCINSLRLLRNGRKGKVSTACSNSQFDPMFSWVWPCPEHLWVVVSRDEMFSGSSSSETQRRHWLVKPSGWTWVSTWDESPSRQLSRNNYPFRTDRIPWFVQFRYFKKKLDIITIFSHVKTFVSF